MRLIAPSWSSLPQRPQFDNSVIQRSTSAFGDLPGGALAVQAERNQRE